MANLTLSIDDDLLQAARVRAVSEGTSVNEICRKAIENYARTDSREDRLRQFDQFMAELKRKRPPGPPAPLPWRNREEMYEHLFSERGEPQTVPGKGRKK